MNKSALIKGKVSDSSAYLESVLSNFKGVNIVMHGATSWDFVIQEGNARPFLLVLLAVRLYGYDYRKLQEEVKYLVGGLKNGEYFPIPLRFRSILPIHKHNHHSYRPAFSDNLQAP